MQKSKPAISLLAKNKLWGFGSFGNHRQIFLTFSCQI